MKAFYIRWCYFWVLISTPKHLLYDFPVWLIICLISRLSSSISQSLYNIPLYSWEIQCQVYPPLVHEMETSHADFWCKLSNISWCWYVSPILYQSLRYRPCSFCKDNADICWNFQDCLYHVCNDPFGYHRHLVLASEIVNLVRCFIVFILHIFLQWCLCWSDLQFRYSR